MRKIEPLRLNFMTNNSHQNAFQEEQQPQFPRETMQEETLGQNETQSMMLSQNHRSKRGINYNSS